MRYYNAAMITVGITAYQSEYKGKICLSPKHYSRWSLPQGRYQANRTTQAARNFRNACVEEARGWFRGRSWLEGTLYLRIAWIQRFPTKQDTDNIAKPISDALSAIIYDDDNRITKYLIERISSHADITIWDDNLPMPVYDNLAALLFQEANDILYMEIGDASAPDFYFGPFAG